MNLANDNIKINKESVITEKKIERKNDKGEEIPEVCPKCGSKIGLYIKGEPVWLCSNKKCNTYFGTLPCNESTEELFQESYIIDKPDLILNMDKWKVGTPLWITGSPGDGKSTFANKMAAENNAIIVHTDTLLLRMSKSKEKFEKELETYKSRAGGDDPISMIYISQHPEIQYNRSFKTGDSRNYHTAQFIKYFDWLINFCSNPPAPYNTQKIIIEGSDICILDPAWICSQPIVILGCSRFTSSYRRIKRMINNGKPLGVALIKLLKSIRSFGMDLWKQKENFYDLVDRDYSSQFLYPTESTGDFINGTVDEIQKIEDSLNKSDDGYKSKHKTYKELIYRDVQYTKDDTEKSHGGWIEMYSKPEYSTDDCNVATIAISVDPESRGTGLSDKLVKGALSAMHKLGIDRIEWYCKKSNTGSYKLAKRAGFKEEPDMSTSTDWVLSYGKKLPKYIKEFTEDFIVESGEFAGKKRSELPDSVFGIPEERKYPMPDRKHVISAIKLFNHVEPKYEEDLAKRIIYRARKYKIDLSFVGEKNRLYKYIHENTEAFESSMEDILNSFDVYTEARREVKNLEDFKKSYHFEPINMTKDDTVKIVDADVKATGLITMGDKKYFCIIGKNIETCAFTKNKDNRVIEELVKKYPKLKETIRNDKLNGYMYGSEYLSGTRYNSQKKHAFIMSHEQGHQELGHTTPDYRLSLDDETIIKNAKAKFNRNLQSASDKFKSNEKDNNALATYKKEVKDAYKKYISEVDRNLSSKDLNANETIRSKMREEARKILKKYELGWHSRVDEFEADLFAKIKSNQSSDQIINTLSNMYRQDEKGKNIEDIKNSNIRIKEDIESRQKAFNDKDIEKYKKAYDLSDKSLDKKILSEKEVKLRAKEINKKRDLVSYNNKRERIKDNIQDSLKYIKDDEKEIKKLQNVIQNNYKGVSPGREKNIDKNLEYYKQDLEDNKKELNEYKAKLKALPYRTESSEGVENMDIVSKMFESFFGEPLFKKSEAESFVDSFFEESNNDSDIPDMIEPEVKKLEAKGYQVKYASPGHVNTTFKNDKNDDKIINGKYRSTGRIIFSRDYNFKNTPKGWEWKSIDDGKKKALYVKPYTYNEELGSKEQVFKRWREFYLKSLVDWIDDLPKVGIDNNENKKDENFSAS